MLWMAYRNGLIDSTDTLPSLDSGENPLELVRCGIRLMEIGLSSRVEGWNTVTFTILRVKRLVLVYVLPSHGNDTLATLIRKPPMYGTDL